MIEPKLNRSSQRPNLNQFVGLPCRRPISPCPRRRWADAAAPLLTVSYNSMYYRPGGTVIPRQPAGIHAGVVARRRAADRSRRARRRRDPPRAGRAEPDARASAGPWSGRRRRSSRPRASSKSRSKRGTVILPRSEWRLLDPDVLAWLTEAGPRPGVPAQHVRGPQDHRARRGPARSRTGHAGGARRDPGCARRWPPPTTRRPSSTPTSGTTRCSWPRRTTTTWSSSWPRSGRRSRRASRSRRAWLGLAGLPRVQHRSAS